MKHLPLLFLLSISVTALKCNKDDETDQSKINFLREKSLTEIKRQLVGNWKIHHRYGGFTGNIKTDLEGSFFKLLSNDSIFVTFNSQSYVADKTNFKRKQTEFGYTAWAIEFKTLSGIGDEWIADYMIRDSLVLVKNSTHPDAFTMTKID
jgi:hypothetical protein